MLKAKTKETLDLILTRPELRPFECYMLTHPKASKRTAQSNVDKILKSTEAIIYRKEHIQLANEVNLETMLNARARKEKPSFQRLASDVAERILDRELGKPVVRQEIKSTRITISLGTITSDK